MVFFILINFFFLFKLSVTKFMDTFYCRMDSLNVVENISQYIWSKSIEEKMLQNVCLNFDGYESFPFINLQNKVIGNIVVTSEDQWSFLIHLFPTEEPRTLTEICKISPNTSLMKTHRLCVCVHVYMYACTCNYQRRMRRKCVKKFLSTSSWNYFTEGKKLSNHGKYFSWSLPIPFFFFH